MKLVGIVVLCFSSLAILMIGLISPLTPSEGAPQLGDILVFLLLPIILLTLGLYFSNSKVQNYFVYSMLFLVAAIELLWFVTIGANFYFST